jgi:hypothetical protein
MSFGKALLFGDIAQFRKLLTTASDDELVAWYAKAISASMNDHIVACRAEMNRRFGRIA